jgi:hypothetical protein
MAKDFIFRVKKGEALPSLDPTGRRLILDEESGQLKTLSSSGQIYNLIPEQISDFKESITYISSNELLNLENDQITILHNNDANKYYLINSLVVEFIHNTTPYVHVDGTAKETQINIVGQSNSRVTINGLSKNKAFYISEDKTLQTGDSLFVNTQYSPTGGDGDMKIIILYQEFIFGE